MLPSYASIMFGVITQYWASQVSPVVDVVLIPGSGRSPGVGSSNLATSSILAWKNSMDRGAWRAVVHWVVEHQT